MRRITLLTGLLVLLTTLSTKAQNVNFITEIVCESSYKPGQTTELTFKVIPNPGVYNQYDWGHLNYLELKFPFGMEVVSSSADFLYNNMLEQNLINDNTISWGSIDGEEYLNFAAPFTFSVNVTSHSLLENVQQITAKTNTLYYETIPSLNESVVQVPEYSPINVSVFGAYFESSGNLRVAFMNVGDEAFSSYNISYSFNNSPVQIFSDSYNLSPGQSYYASIPSGIFQAVDAEILVNLSVGVVGDISENNNVFCKVIKKGTPLFQNYYGSDFCYSIPSFVMNAADESSDEFLVADDFIIPAGQTWVLNQVVTHGLLTGDVLPDRFAISIFNDNDGVPGEIIHYEEINSLQNNLVGHQSLNLMNPLSVEAGKHWISVSGVFDSEIDPNTQNWSWRYTEDTGDESLMFMTEFDSGYYLEQDWGAFMDFAQTGTILSIYGEIATDVMHEMAISFNIYPNPTHDIININGCSEGYYKLFDASAKIIDEGYSYGSIDVSKLNEGCYILKFISGNDVYNSNFVKIK